MTEKANSNPASQEAKIKARWFKLEKAVNSQESEALLNARVGGVECTLKENWPKFCLRKRWTRHKSPEAKKEFGEVKPRDSGILELSPREGGLRSHKKQGD